MANDGYSPDGAFDWPAGATRVVGNTATRPNGFPGTGVDWWRVRLRAGRSYRVQLRRPSFGPEDGGYRYLSIYDSRANAQGNNYWSRSYRYGEDGNYFPSIEWTPSGTGMVEWWVKIDDGNNGFNGYRGEYTLEVTPAPSAWPSISILGAAGTCEARVAGKADVLFPALGPGGIGQATIRSTPADYTWNSICWSPELSLFCAVAQHTSSGIMTSPDGINWTLRSTPNSEWFSVCWSTALHLFCATGYYGNGGVMTSPDGINWTVRRGATECPYLGVCWAPDLGRFCAVANRGNGQAMVSDDGLIWTTAPVPVTNEWLAVCRAPELGLFCAVSPTGSGNRVMTSPDGVNWTTRRSATDNNWRSVAWAPEVGLFCAVAYSGSGDRIMTSPDGMEWTTLASPANNNWVSVCWSPALKCFAAVANSGSGNRIMTLPITPRVDEGFHVIHREGTNGSNQDIRLRAYSPVKPLAFATRPQVLREIHRTARTSAGHGISAYSATEQVYGEAKTDFDELQNPRHPDLVAAWSMDEGAGDRSDLSPAGRTLAVVGSVMSATGMNKTAADLVGSRTDFFEVQNPFHGCPDTQGTVAFWLRPDQNSYRVAFSGGQGSQDQWDFILYNSSNVYWRWLYSGSGSVHTEQSGSSAPTGSWTHFVLRWNEALWEIIRNGVLQNNRSTSAFDMRLGEYWRFGARFDWNNWNGYAAYDGLLDEIAVWKRALTNEEITRLYANGVGMFIDRKAGEEPMGGYHRVIEVRRAITASEWRLISGGQMDAAHVASWQVIDGVYMPYAASRHSLLYPKRNRLFAREVDSGVEHDLGVAEENPSEPGTFTLTDVQLPDGVYEVEARSTDAYWAEARSRKTTTFRLRSGEEPTVDLPAVVNLHAELAANWWRVLTWSVAGDPGDAAFSFGVWFGDDAAVDISGPPAATLPRANGLEHYEHYFPQTAPRYVAVATFADGARGQPAILYLPWDTAHPDAPNRQWATHSN